MSTNISFKKVTHRPAKVVADLSHCKSDPILSIFNISRHFFLASKIRWEMDLHIHTLWNTVSRDHEERRARTSAALGSVATTTKLPYTHEPILCANVVEGDYLRPCISTLSDDQTTKISVPTYWSSVKCCTFFFSTFFFTLIQNCQTIFEIRAKKVFFFTEDQIKNNKNNRYYYLKIFSFVTKQKIYYNIVYNINRDNNYLLLNINIFKK